MSSSSHVLELVEKLSAARPITAAGVGKLVGVSLQLDAQSSNPVFNVLRAATSDDPSVKSAEVRVPVADDREDGLVILEIDTDAESVTQQDVMKRFGASPALLVPSPRQPADDPVYLVYKRVWGELRFGFARPSTEVLTTVIVEVDRSS